MSMQEALVFPGAEQHQCRAASFFIEELYRLCEAGYLDFPTFSALTSAYTQLEDMHAAAKSITEQSLCQYRQQNLRMQNVEALCQALFNRKIIKVQVFQPAGKGTQPATTDAQGQVLPSQTQATQQAQLQDTLLTDLLGDAPAMPGTTGTPAGHQQQAPPPPSPQQQEQQQHAAHPLPNITNLSPPCPVQQQAPPPPQQQQQEQQQRAAHPLPNITNLSPHCPVQQQTPPQRAADPLPEITNLSPPFPVQQQAPPQQEQQQQHRTNPLRVITNLSPPFPGQQQHQPQPQQKDLQKAQAQQDNQQPVGHQTAEAYLDFLSDAENEDPVHGQDVGMDLELDQGQQQGIPAPHDVEATVGATQVSGPGQTTQEKAEVSATVKKLFKVRSRDKHAVAPAIRPLSCTYMLIDCLHDWCVLCTCTFTWALKVMHVVRRLVNITGGHAAWLCRAHINLAHHARRLTTRYTLGFQGLLDSSWQATR